MQQLTPRQTRFVEEYLIDFNGAQAAIRAGYSEKAAKEVAYRLLTYAHVADAVERGSQEVSEKLRITREAVLDGLMEAVSAATNTMELVAAWREIGKIIGAYPSNRVQVEATVKPDCTPTEKQIQGMTDAELLEIINGGRHTASNHQ